MAAIKVAREFGKGSIEYPFLHGQYRLPLIGVMGWLRAGLKSTPGSRPILPGSYLLARLAGRSSLG